VVQICRWGIVHIAEGKVLKLAKAKTYKGFCAKVVASITKRLINTKLVIPQLTAGSSSSTERLVASAVSQGSSKSPRPR